MPQAAELRTTLRDADATFRVVKNTLTERAADQAGAEGLKELPRGPDRDDVRARRRRRGRQGAARLPPRAGGTLLEFKGGWMNGAALSPEEIDAIAQLPDPRGALRAPRRHGRVAAHRPRDAR